MIQSPILAVFLGLVAAGSAAAASEPDIDLRYSLSLALGSPGNPPEVRVTLALPGEDDGETALLLPSEWGGEIALWRVVSGLRVEGDGARLEPGADSSRCVVRHAPGAPLTLRYEVVQDQPGIPRAGGHKNPYRPFVQSEFVHLLGHTIFVRPEADGDRPVSFVLESLPPGWSFASDVEHAAPDRPLRLGNLLESVLVAGDFRVVSRGPAGGALRVALRGAWSFTDEAFVDRLERIVASHRAFWGDEPEPFLVTVLPLAGDPGQSSLGGTGLSDAFAFFATDNAQESTLNRILAHEHLHTWIPRRLGDMPYHGEARDYWLSEGFTDFLTFRLLLKDGIWTLDDYAAAVNEVLAQYAQSPVRAAPNTTIVTDFWMGPDIGQLPYQRGFLLAALWDDRLRRQSNGATDLDDVLLAMNRAWRTRPAGEEPPLASELLIRTLRSHGLDVRADVERHVVRGEPILLPEEWPGPGGRLVTEDRPEFSRGFDPEATTRAGNVVTGLDPDSPAYAAGLRNGMTILKRESGRPGDPTVPLVYLVRDGDVERRIEFLPHGKRRFTMQRLELPAADDTAAREGVRRRLAGE
jgi:predicted metalloprotease with PDZ domain